MSTWALGAGTLWYMYESKSNCLTSKVCSLVDGKPLLVLGHEPPGCPEGSDGGQASQGLREMGIDWRQGHSRQPLQLSMGRRQTSIKVG